MSGHTTSVECKACGKEAWAYFDWKPVPYEVNECMNYECGFVWRNTDDVIETFYQSDKEQIREMRVYMGLEEEVA